MLVGLLSASLLRKLHFPWVVSLIIGGIIIGPQALDIFTPDTTTEFIGELGLTFLMFMAGLETQLSSFKELGVKMSVLAFINGYFPFLLGIGLSRFLGYSPITSLLIGTVFVSSSVAVVIPTLEANDLFGLKIGKSIMTTTILQDVSSLILLSILMQNINPATTLPLYIFYPLTILAIVCLRILLPKLRELFSFLTSKEDVFQDELKAVFVMLIGTVIIFELLGLHTIVGGFFAGLVLSDSITDKVLMGKIRAICYGIFVPTFFVLIGLHTDVDIIFRAEGAWRTIYLITVGSIAAKFLSGFLGSLLVGFNKKHAIYFGASSIPQLSTTLAVAYSAKSFGFFTNELFTALVTLSIVSTFIGPFIMNSFSRESLRVGE
jgi:Kef-type K+ transport system membrane component KefB